jgi:2-keto-4-pentenoate hydratase/2-oxohepta-3-ene-1,7-dioic acid hydratase in catechol pathway
LIITGALDGAGMAMATPEIMKAGDLVEISIAGLVTQPLGTQELGTQRHTESAE